MNGWQSKASSALQEAIEMATNYPINPRVRAYGKARLDIARRARTPAEWQRLWLPPAQRFTFQWGRPWKQCIEYKVDDLAAEVGFYIDVLGLPVNAFNPDYAMFTSPDGDFYFAVVPAYGGSPSTPPDAIRLQFMLADILATAAELQARGIEFEAPPAPIHEGSNLYIGYFRSPHGIPIELWGVVSEEDDLQIGFNFNEPTEAENLYADQPYEANLPAEVLSERPVELEEIEDEAEPEDDLQYEVLEDAPETEGSDYGLQYEDLEE
jgi:catechol 2,3-dioxygenase-like lactoylglutathione lyase family enzyme